MNEIIFCYIFVITIILVIILIACLLVRIFILEPIANFYINKKTNKLQWECSETCQSKEARLKGKDLLNEYILSYKVLNSELPLVSKIFGDNDWIQLEQDNTFIFKSENEFKEFVSKFKTKNDIDNYYKNLNNTIIWYYNDES